MNRFVCWFKGHDRVERGEDRGYCYIHHYSCRRCGRTWTKRYNVVFW